MTDLGPPQWERAVLEKIALKALDEQRRQRQWNALFRLLWLIFFFLLLSAFMASSLDLETIAEGVETEGQLNLLRTKGCRTGQGFYFSRAVPARELYPLLRSNNAGPTAKT